MKTLNNALMHTFSIKETKRTLSIKDGTHFWGNIWNIILTTILVK